jgi:hypothetical protein
MKRRTCLKTLLAAAGAIVGAEAQTSGRPIRLLVDLSVDPAKEKEMLRIFETSFRPAAMKQPGFIELKMLKLRSALMGKGPQGMNYRFSLTMESEELRQKWIATDVHNKLGPMIEATLTTKDYTVLLFDVY